MSPRFDPGHIYELFIGSLIVVGFGTLHLSGPTVTRSNSRRRLEVVRDCGSIEPYPAAYVLFALKLSPYFQSKKGEGIPMAIPMNPRSELPQSNPNAEYM